MKRLIIQVSQSGEKPLFVRDIYNNVLTECVNEADDFAYDSSKAKKLALKVSRADNPFSKVDFIEVNE